LADKIKYVAFVILRDLSGDQKKWELNDLLREKNLEDLKSDFFYNNHLFQHGHVELSHGI